MSNNDAEEFFSVDDDLDLPASLDAENKTNKSNFKLFLSEFEYYLRKLESNNNHSKEDIEYYLNKLVQLKSKIDLENNLNLKLKYDKIKSSYSPSADENDSDDNRSVISDINMLSVDSLNIETPTSVPIPHVNNDNNSESVIVKNLDEEHSTKSVYIFADLSTHEYKSSADSRQKHTQTILETGIPLTSDQTNLLYQKGGTQVFEPFTDHPYQLKFEQIGHHPTEKTHQATLEKPNFINDDKKLAHTIINMIENILAQGNGRLNINTNDEKSAYIAHTYFSFLKEYDNPNHLEGITYNNPLGDQPSKSDKYTDMGSIVKDVMSERYSNNLHDMFWFKSAVKASTDKLGQDDDYSSSPSLRR